MFPIGEINHQSAWVMMSDAVPRRIRSGVRRSAYINSPAAVDDTLAPLRHHAVPQQPGEHVPASGVRIPASGASDGGHQGQGFILPHAKVMIHQPFGA